jgi:hypothetical protein
VRGVGGALKDFSIRHIFGHAGGLCINSNKLLAATFWKYYNASVGNCFETGILMLLNPFTCLLSVMLVAGSAVAGVIVEKRSRLLPDSSIPGTEGVYSFVFRGPTGTSRLPITVPRPDFWPEQDGMFTFVVRDSGGHLCSEMVTADVFARYRVGDDFNDLALSVTRQEQSRADDNKSVQPVIVHWHRRSIARHDRRARRSHHALAKHHRHHSSTLIARR